MIVCNFGWLVHVYFGLGCGFCLVWVGVGLVCYGLDCELLVGLLLCVWFRVCLCIYCECVLS